MEGFVRASLRVGGSDEKPSIISVPLLRLGCSDTLYVNGNGYVFLKNETHDPRSPSDKEGFRYSACDGPKSGSNFYRQNFDLIQRRSAELRNIDFTNL